jgi:CRISPR type I-E-associated protein CasB/Cse2
LLVSEALQDVLRDALKDAETVAEALQRRVLFVLALELRGPISADITAVRENLRTLPDYWEALGARIQPWVDALGRASDPTELREAWSRQIRAVAREVMARAVDAIGLRGRAIRAAAKAESVLEQILAEHLPLPEGAAAEARIVLPEHSEPVWSDKTEFVPFLEGLVRQRRLDALAALRRSLQEPSGIAEEARPLVGPLIPANTGARQRGLYFLVAALFATHREHHEGVSLADGLRRVKDSKRRPMPSLDERFESFLAAHADDLGAHLRSLLPIVYEHCAIDWTLLLRDLIFWPRQDRIVQRELARKYFHPVAEASHHG